MSATNVARGRNRETFVSAGKARLKIVSQSRISETSDFVICKHLFSISYISNLLYKLQCFSEW